MEFEDEQYRLLDAALKVVKEQAYYMKRAIEKDSLKLVLDHATEMLREMRTSLLTPKNYYELYMKVIDEMRELEEYFYILQRKGRSMMELYEQVQGCGNILPRLYMLVCAGSVYIASLEAPAKDVLKDMTEMLRGVQHPMRGLFLRNYLTTVSKNKLPDAGSVFHGNGGTVQDAYNFIIQNFLETNRLWIRLQSQGDSRDKKKREKQRLDLRILVGLNLVRLSQLQGLESFSYKHYVLPRILAEVVGCDDAIAQTYLMDCIIQVFPDEFHLATLEQVLQSCVSLKEKVNTFIILSALIERLAVYYQGQPFSEDTTHNDNGQAVLSEEYSSGNNLVASSSFSSSLSMTDEVFRHINVAVSDIIRKRISMSLAEALKLQSLLIHFVTRCFPTRLDFVAETLASCCVIIDSYKGEEGLKFSSDCTLHIEALLLAAQNTFLLRILDIPAYSTLLSYLPWGSWKDLAKAYLRTLTSAHAMIRDEEKATQLFEAIIPLTTSDKDDPSISDPSTSSSSSSLQQSEFVEEQALVAKSIHLLEHEDTDVLLRMYLVAKKHVAQGGPRRIVHTAAPLIFCALALTRRVHWREQAVAKQGAIDAAEDGDVADIDEAEIVQAAPTPQEVEAVSDSDIGLEKDSGDFEADGEVKSGNSAIEAVTVVAEDIGPDFDKTGVDTEGVSWDETGEVMKKSETDDKVEMDGFKEESNEDGVEKKELKPSLGFGGMKRVTAPKYGAKKVFHAVIELVTSMAAVHPELSIDLFMQSAQASNECGYGAIAFEFVKEALLLYECEMSDSRIQMRALTLMVGTLLICTHIPSQDYASLVAKVAQCSNKLTRKPDQCRMVCLCSHLFWPPVRGDGRYSDAERALECAQRALKIASTCDPNLFVEILDRYLYMYEMDNPAFQVRYVSGLIALINEQVLPTARTQNPSVLAHFNATLAYIRTKQQESESEKFAAIQLT